MRAVTARRKLVTAAPLGVKVTSGSSVRLPTMVTWVSSIDVPSSGLGVVLVGWSRWWSGRYLLLLSGRVGEQVPAGVGSQSWSATVLASCLLVGLRSSPAPGDRWLRAASSPARSRD